MFNGDTPNQYLLSSQTSFYSLKLQLCGRQTVQHISWSQDHSTSLHISEPILQTFIPSVNYVWYYHLNWFIVNSLFLFPNYCFKSVWKSSIIGNFKFSFFKSFIISFFYIPANSLYIYNKTHLICFSTKIFLIFILI